MNELKEQIRKLLVDNGCRLDNDSAVSRTVDLLATYTAQKELEELKKLPFTDRETGCMDCLAFSMVKDRMTQLSSQLKESL